MIELQRIDTGQWRHYHLLINSVVVAWGKWRKDDLDPLAAEFHNETFRRTKSVLLLTKTAFEQIRRDMRDAGCTRVVVCDLTRNVDKTRRKYWKFMGFDFVTVIGDCTAAVREA